LTVTLAPNDWLLGRFCLLRSALERTPFSESRGAERVAGVGALRDREPDAWRALFAQEAPAIFRYVRGRIGSAEDAEDLTSQVFEEAWRHIGTLRDQGLPPRAWLFGIARNLVGTHRRKLFRRPPILAIEAFDGSGGDPASSPEALDLVRAIHSLRSAHAEVIALRFVHDLSIEETAAALGITVDSVKGKQARALATLRKQMDASGDHPVA